jgi:hypothetical protein
MHWHVEVKHGKEVSKWGSSGSSKAYLHIRKPATLEGQEENLKIIILSIWSHQRTVLLMVQTCFCEAIHGIVSKQKLTHSRH